MFARSLLRPSAIAFRSYSTAPAPTLEKTLRSAMMQAMKAKDSPRVTVIKVGILICFEDTRPGPS